MITMSNPELPSTTPVVPEYPRKVGLLLLIIINVALGLFYLFELKPGVHLLARAFLADMSMGLVAGFGTRTLLGRRNWFVRMITASASLIIGLLVLGVLSGWKSGLGPLSFWRTTIDWYNLAHILLGGGGIFLAMQAWSRPRASAAAQAAAAPANGRPRRSRSKASNKSLPGEKPKRKRKSKADQAISQPAAAAPALNTPVRAEPVTVVTAPPQVPATSRVEPTERPAAAVRAGKPVSPAPARTSMVRLSKVETHLCPYCLEPVLNKDPRGIVECDICHTQHHGDCWAIAGFCQVPHFTA
jgi:hypothetical protein